MKREVCGLRSHFAAEFSGPSKHRLIEKEEQTSMIEAKSLYSQAINIDSFHIDRVALLIV